jgi:CHASE1-domain containing sensor protein
VVLRELGRGGMGVVYLAHDPQLNRPVALKMILAAEFAPPEAVGRFRAETAAVAGLRHPNIVQIYEVGEHDGRPYSVLEYVAGGTLAQRLGGQRLPPREAAGLVLSLARAVQAVHRQGIIHRDLKPANVLLDGGPEAPIAACTPKLTDFGLVKLLPDPAAPEAAQGMTRTGDLLGTPGYMAPEQATATKEAVGPETDVYGLGAILYELLTGKPPFQGPTFLAIVFQVLQKDPVPLSRVQPGLPRDLQTICMKCLHKRRADRYPTAAALADDLQRFLNGEPIRARPAAALEVAWRWVRRHPARAAALGIGLLALLTLGWAAVAAFYNRELAAALAVADAHRRQAEAALVEAEVNRQRAEAAEFQLQAEDHADALQASLDHHLEGLHALGAFYAASEVVDREEFRRFVRRTLARHADIRALQWVPVVPGGERARFEAAAQRDGVGEYRFTEADAAGRLAPAAARAEYYPVYFVEPAEENRTTLGFDHATQAERWAALVRARDTGQPAATARVRLIATAPDRDLYGCLLFLPVYQNGAPTATAADRRAHLHGFVAAVIDLTDLAERALRPLRRQGLEVVVRDTTAGGELLCFYGSPVRQAAVQTGRGPALLGPALWSKTLPVAGREWQVIVQPPR